MGDNHDYIVLARKYRSRTFAELVGQEALVRTLTNAIAAGRLHHAYLLTGIRGTGKTSTARLLAMALNCENGPSATWAETDQQVESIRTGRHVDVYEFDAASNRSVEDIQRLFEGVYYAPVSGRFKVYIIDEVHMLSTTAFNALLKTLEEPPPQVKFIFATTDVQKIPLTVLSRCQRFDLKRIPSEVLAPYFSSILAKEHLEAEPSAIQLIARAADGSVRDGLSLLDQAIALSHGQPINLSIVEDMLGVADRAIVWPLLTHLLKGESASALAQLDGLYAGGTDALGLLQAILESLHLLTRLKIIPSLATNGQLTELESRHAVPLAEQMALPQISRAYQVAFAALADVKNAPRPYEALSMALVRVAYLSPLPPLDQLLKQAEGQLVPPTIPAASAGAMASHTQANQTAHQLPIVTAGLVRNEKAQHTQALQATLPASWSALVASLRAEKPALAAELERQVRCESLENTHLTLHISRGLKTADQLTRELKSTLLAHTGQTWQIDVKTEHNPDTIKPATLAEVRIAQERERIIQAAASDELKAALNFFPGAEIEAVHPAEPTLPSINPSIN
jgi:DNA polymerase-3 subunit gamma/tau